MTSSLCRFLSVHINDVSVTASLDGAYRDGALSVTATIKSAGCGLPAGYLLEAQLYDANDAPLWAKPILTAVTASNAGQRAVSFTQTVANPRQMVGGSAVSLHARPLAHRS